MNKTLGALGAVALTLTTASALAADAYFPSALFENTTGFADSLFLGAPNGSSGNGGSAWVGIGGKVVTFEFTEFRIFDGPGNDINVYEVDFGANEFSAADFSFSQDGVNFFLVDGSIAAIVPVDNDPGHVDDAFARSFDLFGTGLAWARYFRIDGGGTGVAGGTNGFDLDAVGAVNYETAPVPVPAAVWLFGSALAGLATLRRRATS